MSDEKMREAFESTFIEKPTVARHGLYELSWVRCEWSEFKRGWKAAIESMKEDTALLHRVKDAGYLERNQVVAALARLFPSGLTKTAIDGWSDDWHGCVFIDLPTGQASWHYHDSQEHLFEGLPAYTGKWDGHDTNEKYRRLAALESMKVDAEQSWWVCKDPDADEDSEWEDAILFTQNKSMAGDYVSKGYKVSALYTSPQPDKTKELEEKNRKLSEMVSYLGNELAKFDDCELAQEWISVKDRLPEDKSKEYLTLDGRNEVCVTTGHFISSNIGNCFSKTHWMPLPPQPTKGDDESI